MPEDKKPLPKPPSTPFGSKKRFGDEENNEGLIADKMSMAMAGGNIEEFMKKEIGDNANAQKLASMMMGMSGMSPGGIASQGAPVPPEPPELQKQQKSQGSQGSQKQQEPGSVASPSTPPSEEIMKAAMSGDTKSLAEMLKKEHLRRQGADTQGQEETPAEAQHEPQQTEGSLPVGSTAQDAPEGAPEPEMEKQVLMKLMKIASDNNVSIDWVINRALKLYVRDFEGTGRI